VSFPGYARKNPQTRKGKWQSTSLPVDQNWRFASDEESHLVTERQNPGYRLTGKAVGRQIWWYDEKSKTKKASTMTFDPASNPNSADIPFRTAMQKQWKGHTPDLKSTPPSAADAAEKGLSFYQILQCEDGHWAGDYGGPMFLMPGLVCALYISKLPFPRGRKEAMILYLKNHQQIDGGWGTHIECASTMFGTILSYLALRLLGEPSSAPYLVEARNFIHSHGGALYAPSWAKFWMAIMGVYDWRGINSIPAELWLLPRWFWFHPGKLWCHCRMVYLPMCYLYCARFTADVDSDATLQSLRKELYCEPYDSIEWDDFRQTCAGIDEYSPLNPVMKLAQDFLALYERWLPSIPVLKSIRARGLRFVLQYIHAEDAQTNFVDIGPVNKCLNMVCVWAEHRSSNTDCFQRHMARVDDYLWVAEDGMKMQGYNGSQCWDTSFAAQAIAEGRMAEKFSACARKVYSFIDHTQIEADEADREYYYRHISKGGWPFSTAAHGWPISDCTAEGLKCVLSLHKCKVVAADGTVAPLIPFRERISDRRLQDACDVLLSFHNSDGGWATYENMRGYGWYEMLNPSEVFGDIMIDYSYVECSSACMTALAAFSTAQPEYRRAEVLNAIASGCRFLKSIQRSDGSWYGSWGCCFTYGTWFGIEGLITAGETKESSHAVLKAVKFLLSKQNSDGGWGENYLACVNKSYSKDGIARGAITSEVG
jgi:cycloartenol synthase